ncbi:GGDEF domain-containing protein [Candidatus Amarobacter glycogenicus]|jgi:two-component system cell cycle response regulator|uniref:GGDEF domain-containing protein n=1 Tax=Candidatus Amarobacter glycogenicus TaxID=3140699 RepID=UPI003136037A|nr:GGDEF domain-containing protein [Dehalococcoidia bacterium]MBK9342738.1 GGDEF domain-containing protein [Dehalococcoidia bacterium]
MERLSGPVFEHPAVERASQIARLIGFGCWLIGLVIFAAACLSGEPVLFAAFGAFYVSLAGIVGVTATVPRKRQAALDREWGRRFQELAIRDELTGLHNRRYFNSELESQFRRCQSDGAPLSIALVDLNDFKSINDTFGHAAGDVALRVAGRAILAAAPADATVARTGGDEFAILMPGKSRDEGEVIANAVRNALESARFMADLTQQHGQIRATVGIATLDAHAEPSALLHQADVALYSRKRAAKAA